MEEGFKIIRENGEASHLECEHCGQRVERGIFNVSSHWANCFGKETHEAIMKEHEEKSRRLTALPSPKFIAEANSLCDTISAGMKGLDREHSFESYEDLILAILRKDAETFGPYAETKEPHPVCDVCGSTDVIEAPHMGRNCNTCHPL